MQFTCGKCRQVFTVGEEMRGRVYTCGHCGARMKIPGTPPGGPPREPPGGPPGGPPSERRREPPAEDDALERLTQAQKQPPAVPPPQTSPYGTQQPPGVARPAENAPGAVASMVLGIAGILSSLTFCCCIFLAIPGPILGGIAIVMSVSARRHIRLSPQRYGGKGMATAGLVLGIISVVLGLIGILLAIVLQVSQVGRRAQNFNFP